MIHTIPLRRQQQACNKQNVISQTWRDYEPANCLVQGYKSSIKLHETVRVSEITGTEINVGPVTTDLQKMASHTSQLLSFILKNVDVYIHSRMNPADRAGLDKTLMGELLDYYY